MSKGKIGILCSAHLGDISLCTSALKYKDQLWPDKDIIWFASLLPQFASRLDILKFNDAISEVRECPPVIPGFKKLINPETGRLLPERQNDFENLKDLEIGYFPAPWAVRPHPKWDNLHYFDVPKKVFGIDPSWEWHPYLKFSAEEEEMAKDFCLTLPYKRTIMLETSTFSSNFQFSDDIIRTLMYTCRSKFKDCNFIFASKMDKSSTVCKYSQFLDTGVVTAENFTVRQTALLHNYCDLFIGCGSGISVATCCWGGKPVPRVEQVSSSNHSAGIANGPTVSILADNISHVEAGRRLVIAVSETLDKYY